MGMMDSTDVVRKLAHLKLPFMNRWQFEDAISDAIACIESQAKIIASLKSDLQETLDVVSKQTNIGRCEECEKRLTTNCFCDYMARKNPKWFCAGFEPSDEAVEDAFGKDG